MEMFGDHQVFPVTETAALEVLSIPVHPSLSQADLEKVANTINEFILRK
jgi:dTDP-4-amino-4,6-dideoxygalactose transaminase